MFWAGENMWGLGKRVLHVGLKPEATDPQES